MIKVGPAISIHNSAESYHLETQSAQQRGKDTIERNKNRPTTSDILSTKRHRREPALGEWILRFSKGTARRCAICKLPGWRYE